MSFTARLWQVLLLVVSWKQVESAISHGTANSNEHLVDMASACKDPEWDLGLGSKQDCSGSILLEQTEPVEPRKILAFLLVMWLWALVALIYEVRERQNTGRTGILFAGSLRQLGPQVRDGRWDRVRFHLMTCIIWSHWLGKWGLAATKTGWACLNCVFTFHVTGFVVLSGTFCAKYVKSAHGRYGQWRVMKGCIELLLVYIIFSWLRGIVHTSLGEDPTGIGILTTTLNGTFLFHQGPWYLAALIMWRCSAFLLNSLPFAAQLTFALFLAGLCPYKALAAAHDPLALREFLHYLPFFVIGLGLGQEGLEKATRFAGDRSAMFALCSLTTLAFLVWFPFGFLYGSKDYMWVLLMKGVPPPGAGGFPAMLALYAVKLLATICALTLFSCETSRDVDKVCEAAGRRSMLVYMVHMVFVMVPGEQLSLREHIFARFGTESSVATQVMTLFIIAVAVNLLCGSSFTDMLFRPLVEPLKYVDAIAAPRGKLDPESLDEATAFATKSKDAESQPSPVERARW